MAQKLLSYSSSCSSDVVAQKISPVITEIRSVNIDTVDDNLISKFLTICQLRKELLEKKDG